ncbi:MAG: hypothetical protein ACFFAH_13045 [Promethearchaeota archaeon]
MLKDSVSTSEINGINASVEVKKVNVICPICKSKQVIDVPESIINQSTQLTTVSVPKNLVCKHHFQAFVDKQFKVRGYQKVDFELANKNVKGESLKESEKSDDKLFNNLILEGNHLEYKPNKIENHNINRKDDGDLSNKNKEMELQEIYEEFWEFIDDDNHEFKEFIIKDKKRREALKKRIHSKN